MDKQFLISQRQKGRPGTLMGVDWISQKREFKRSKQLEKSEKKGKLNENKIKSICKYFVFRTLWFYNLSYVN